MPRAVKLDPSEPLADARRERFARLRAIGVPVIEAADRAEFRTAAGYSIFPGNAHKINREDRVRARIAYLAKDEPTIIVETREFVRRRLMTTAGANLLRDFGVVEGGRLVGLDWEKLKASDASAVVTGFRFDAVTGHVIGFDQESGLAAVQQLRDVFGLKGTSRVAAEISGPGGTAMQVNVKVYDEIDAVRRAIVAIEEEAARAAAEQLAAETGAAEEGAE